MLFGGMRLRRGRFCNRRTGSLRRPRGLRARGHDAAKRRRRRCAKMRLLRRRCAEMRLLLRRHVMRSRRSVVAQGALVARQSAVDIRAGMRGTLKGAVGRFAMREQRRQAAGSCGMRRSR